IARDAGRGQRGLWNGERHQSPKVLPGAGVYAAPTTAWAINVGIWTTPLKTVIGADTLSIAEAVTVAMRQFTVMPGGTSLMTMLFCADDWMLTCGGRSESVTCRPCLVLISTVPAGVSWRFR